jgi:hypothetical protein
MRLVAERSAHGELSLDEAGRELDRRADRILEKRRWLLAHGAHHELAKEARSDLVDGAAR